MIKNGVGGANTQTGIIFEDKVELCTFLNDQVNDYHVEILGKAFILKKTSLLFHIKSTNCISF